MTFEQRYERLCALAEKALLSAVPLPEQAWGATCAPRCLAEAMRYSLLAGGKRLRPVMLLAAYEAAGGDAEAALPFAAAIEMIHTYSLVHDDLPAMDNDDLRRGKPTNHKVFGEGMAVLAGDALLTHAFETMALSQHGDALRVVALFASCAGVSGMIAGQTADLEMEGHTPDIDMVRYIQERKTSALFSAAVVGGLMLAGADAEKLHAGHAFALHYGLAFQITDDILDIEGDAKLLGKTTGKDDTENKMTWPSVAGIERAREDAKTEASLAIKAAEVFDQSGFFSTLAKNVLERVQ